MRYLLFAFDDHYPRGGWNDFLGGFDTIEAAVAAPKTKDPNYRYGENWHVVDAQTGHVVAYDPETQRNKDERSEWFDEMGREI
jgi:hypothetical protein